MKQLNSDTFQELHHAPKEYCRESGPLNSKEGSFPALLNGLELVAAALAALALLNTLLSLSIVSSPLSILSNRAYIEVDVRNWPDEGDLTYILTPADDPERILTSGEIFSDPQDLELEGLTSETEYILTFFHNDEVVGDYSFSTGSDQPIPTNPTTEPTTSPTTIPTTAPTTVPTTEPTTAPTTEPVTVPTEPPATKPTDPPETEPNPEPSPITGTAQVLDVQDLSVDSILYGFIFVEQHTFTNVPEPSEIKITQGEEYLIEKYEEYYDPATKTLTITFGDSGGSIIPPGEAVTSLVSVTFSDGSVGESTEVLCAPKLNSLDLSISHNTTDLLYVDFQFSGACVLPSVGSIANLKVEIWPYGGEDVYLEYSHSDLGFNLEEMFQFTISEKLEFPGSPTTARAVLSGEWIVGERSFELRIPVSVTYPTEEVSEDTEDPDSSTEGNTENGESETTATEDGDSSAQTGSSTNPTDPTETTGEAIQPPPTETVIQNILTNGGCYHERKEKTWFDSGTGSCVGAAGIPRLESPAG